ncbi:MAG TPA: phosphoribosyl-ATP diphosphatase, partial [Bacillota bacterium]|nr:phosphoribosyl-ATP diphosphatase [Bacillota bacterium]
LTLTHSEVHFYSRSRKRLWRKGESSGNTQRLRAARYDCDGDAILLYVDPAGPACHLGTSSCFTRELHADSALKFTEDATVLCRELTNLRQTVASRRGGNTDVSYTAALLASGTARICQKIGEEATELVIAAMQGIRKDTVSELADLVYHILVFMEGENIEDAELARELASRRPPI